MQSHLKAPDWAQRKLDELEAITQEYPYGRWSGRSTLSQRLVDAHGWLTRAGLDADAFLVLVSLMRYFTPHDRSRLWSSLGARLSTQLSRVADGLDRAVFFQPKAESHVADLFVAAGWSRRREQQSNLNADAMLEYICSRRPESIRDLAELDRMPVWVMVWDQNLSGRTLGTQLHRLQLCQSMMPSSMQRYLFGLAPVTTAKATRKVQDKCPQVEFMYDVEVPTLADEAILSHGEWAARIVGLCRTFFERFVEPRQPRDNLSLRDVGALGYGETGVVVSTEINCANNCPPVLWYSFDDFEAPFPRRSSGHPITVEEVRTLGESDVPHLAAKLAFAFGIPRGSATTSAIEGRPLQYWTDRIEECTPILATPREPLENYTRVARQALEWLPDTEDLCWLRAIAQAVLLAAAMETNDPAAIDVLRELMTLRIRLRQRPQDANNRKALVEAGLLVRRALVRFAPTPTDRSVVRTASSAFATLGENRLHRGRCLEPLTTRTAHVRTVAKEIATGRAKLVSVFGVPGWGKSWFADLVLAELGKPVRIVDLSACVNAHDICEHLLASIPLDEHQQQLLDFHPANAVSVLIAQARHGGTVLFENAERWPPGTLPEGLAEFVTAFTHAGFHVILETWSNAAKWDGVPEMTHQPGPLTMDEVVAWAAGFGIELNDSAKEALALLEGHPSMLHDVLTRAAHRGFDADAVLEMAASGDEIHRGAPYRDRLANALYTRIALLPWSTISADELDSATQTEMLALAAGGLFHGADGGPWTPSAWIRVESIRRLKLGVFDTSLVDPKAVARSPPDTLTVTIRHLERLQTDLPQDHPAMSSGTLPSLLRVMPPMEGVPGYVAPTSVASSLDLNVSTIAMVLIAEREARTNARVPAEYFQALRQRRDLFDVLLERWEYVKAFHTTLVRGNLAIESRISACQAVAVPLRNLDPLSLPRATRAWLARLIGSGSRMARMLFDFATADELAATSLAVLPEPPPYDEYARDINYETRYLVQSAPTISPRNVDEDVMSHLSALEAIPAPQHWIPGGEDKWRAREMSHLLALCRVDADAELTNRVTRAFDTWPPSASWASAFRGFHELWHACDAARRDALEGTLERASARVGGPDAGRIAALLKLLHPNAPPVAECLSYLEASAATRDDIDREMLRLSLQRIDYEEFVPGDRGRFLASVEAALERIVASYSEDADRRADAGLLVRLLNAWMDHQVHWDDEQNYNDTLVRFTRARDRIDSQFSAVIRRTGDPTFYHSWCDARLKLARNHRFVRIRQLLTITNTPRVEPKLESGLAAGLTALAARVVIESNNHPSATLGAILIHDYLWNHRQALELLESLSMAEFYHAGRTRSMHICLEVLARIALTPRELLAEPFTTAELARASARLEALVDIMVQLGRDDQHRRWWRAMGAVLAGANDAALWQDFVAANTARLETPDDYWALLSLGSMLNEPYPQNAPFQVQDLTDTEDLTVAATLLRFGALQRDLPLVLRQQVAELAIVMADAAAKWRRSWSISRTNLLDEWRCGLTIGIALSVSPDGRLFGRSTSYRIGASGKPVGWWQLCQTHLKTVVDRAPGAFSQHARTVKEEWLESVVPRSHRI